MHVLDRVRRTIREEGLAGPSTRVVAAVSGGSDSVALSYLLKRLHDEGEFILVGLCHFDHQIRPSSSEDARFCGSVAEAIGLPLLVGGADVVAQACAAGRSIESAARIARYAFFEQARVHFSADAVALGHTRDDQAETFLLRLLRGAGARGLGGMHHRRGIVVRPLLECRRMMLREYLQQLQIAFVDDESNADVSIPRNRVRAELLPLLESRFNPAVVNALASAADVARGEWAWLRRVAAAESSHLCHREPDRWTIDAAGISRLPVAVARVVLRTAMEEAAGSHPVSFRHVEEARRLASLGGGPVHGPRCVVERCGPVLVLRTRGAGERGRPAPAGTAAGRGGLVGFSAPLPIPGKVALEPVGAVISAENAPPGADWRAVLSTREAAVVRGDLAGGFVVRGRQPGDRFRPFGSGHSKKLQDFFVDRKVPRDRRDQVPIVTDTTGRIVWVGGYEIDEEFAVTDPAQAVIILRLKVVGGLA